MSPAPTQPPTPLPLLATLKAATAHLHDQIEQVVPLLRPQLDRTGYATYLAVLLGYVRPLEERLSVFAPAWRVHGLEFGSRRKTALLESDLVALGHTRAQVDALPNCSQLPFLPTVSEAWGCLYVMEGSTLGGQVIQRTLGPRLQLTAEHGLAFLCGYADRTGSSWKAFAASMGRFELDGADREAAVRGACETFQRQMDWLARRGAP